MKHLISCAVIAGLLWGGSVQPAAGQLTQGAPGAIGGLLGGHEPPDPNRTATRWTVTADLGGGQDTVPVETEGPGAPGGGTATAAAGTGAVSTRLWRGRTSRSFEMSAGGFVNRQNEVVDQLHGANASVRASAGVRTGLSTFFNATYQPLLLSNAVGNTPLDPTAQTVASQASVGPPNGVFDQKWLSTQAGASVFRNWTPRNRLDGTVSVWQWRPLEGTGLQSTSTAMSVQESVGVGTGRTLRFIYSFERNVQTGITPLESRTRMHTPEVGMRFQKRLSPLRNLTADIQGGVSHAWFQSPGVASTASVVPVGSASIQANVSRYWTLGVNAGREVAVLNVFSNQPFKADQVAVQLNGMVARRLSISTLGGYARGSAALDDPGAYEGFTAVARAQYGLANWCGVFGSYSYYRQLLTHLQTPAGSFLTDFGRHGVRVGVTLWLPMFGTF